MLYVVVLICAASAPKCDAEHARAYQAFTAPPGIIVCGAPAVVGGTVNSAIAPDEQEYLRVRCVYRAP